MHFFNCVRLLSKAVVTLSLSIFFLSLVTTTSFASEQFDIELVSKYTVNQVGITKVAHTFNVTNKEPTIFLTQYALQTNYPDLKNVVVRYNNTIIPPTVVQSNEGTSIAVTFPDEVVGQGKKRTFTIEYINTNLATLAGSVLEMYIPAMPEAAEYAKHVSIVEIPEKMGYPTRINANPTKVETGEGTLVLFFEEQKGSAVTALFGDTQRYSLNLRYQLENSTGSTALTQIALPPETAFQRVHINSIDPLPTKLKTDTDGNWIATYTLAPTSAVTVHVDMSMLVSLTPNTVVPVVQPTSKHLEQLEYWEVTAPIIQELARKYKTPQTIHEYLVQTLSYTTADLSSGSIRQGAVAALAQPEAAVCQEFSDTFVTIARAAGIPARRNAGYAYTQDAALRPASFEGDVLHAWPEYWDDTKKLWIPTDPTWEQTTGGVDYFSQFDLNHLVFTINGESSITPYPAGAYKQEGSENSQNITVKIADSFPDTKPSFSITIIPKKILGIPLPGLLTAVIQNQTGKAWYNTQVVLRPEENDTTLQLAEQQIPVLLPYQQKKIALTAYHTTTVVPKDVVVEASLTNPDLADTYEHQPLTITTGPAVIQHLTNYNTLIAVAGGSIILTLTAGSILVFRRK